MVISGPMARSREISLSLWTPSMMWQLGECWAGQIKCLWAHGQVINRTNRKILNQKPFHGRIVNSKLQKWVQESGAWPGQVYPQLYSKLMVLELARAWPKSGKWTIKKAGVKGSMCPCCGSLYVCKILCNNRKYLKITNQNHVTLKIRNLSVMITLTSIYWFL